MQSFRFYILKIILFVAGLTISLSACQKGGGSGDSSQSPAPITPPTSQGGGSGGGGIDGSGGDSVQSSLEEVKKAYAEELKALPQRLRQMTREFKSFEEYVYDYKYRPGARKIMGSFLIAEKIIEEHPRYFQSILAKNLQSGDIQIKTQQAPCSVQDGTHAGSAKGDYNKGEICISFEKLQSIPPFVLNQEIFTLLIHELSHLSGFTEKQAVEIQKLLSFNRDMYAGYADAGFINGLRACDYQTISKENEEMKNSPYWQQQKRKLVELLSGSQPRGCGDATNKMTDRVDIFSDDAEFLEATGKFPRSGYNYEITNKARGEAGTYFTTDSVQEISTVASIHLETSTAILWSLPAKIGTNAQCSPKILLANLIANIPDILELDCGMGQDKANSIERIKDRIIKEKEILDGEKRH